MLGKDIPIRTTLLDVNTNEYVASFDCSNEGINFYLRNNAVHDVSSVTHLFIDERNNHVVAFATLAATGITIEKGFQDDEEMSTTLIPAYEIKYFAVDKSYQHMRYCEEEKETLSYFILSHIISYIEDIAGVGIGALQIVLYSVMKATHFYQRSGFRGFNNNMRGDQGYNVENCIPMYLEISHGESIDDGTEYGLVVVSMEEWQEYQRWKSEHIDN